LEQFGCAPDDPGEFLPGVVVEATLESEAAAQGCGEEAGTGSGADESESREVETDASCVGPLIDEDVDAEILHRRVEELLDHLGDAMDLIDEEDLTVLKGGEESGEVSSLLHHGPGGDSDGLTHLGTQDEGERGLTKTRRAVEQDVIEGAGLAASCPDHHAKALDGTALASEVSEARWTQRGVE
jgi:hypothetical protein